jgi:ribokinase
MKPDSPEIIVVGSLHLDIVVHANARPEAGETIAGTAWDMRSGGKGGNQAIQAAQHGARTAMISRVGQDDFGATLRQRLQEAGVDTSYLTTDTSGGSGMGIALIDSQGVPGGVTVSGVNGNIGSSDLLAAEAAFAGAAWLLLQQEIPQATNIEAARLARRHGVRVILNAAPAYPLADELAGNVDILVVNEVEAGMLSGVRVGDAGSAMLAAETLAFSIPVVLVTLGDRGVVLKEKDKPAVHVPAYDVSVRDALGAGDAFIGGLAARLVGGAGLLDATEYATAVGALTVSAASGLQPGPAGVREFMRTSRRLQL